MKTGVSDLEIIRFWLVKNGFCKIALIKSCNLSTKSRSCEIETTSTIRFTYLLFMSIVFTVALESASSQVLLSAQKSFSCHIPSQLGAKLGAKHSLFYADNDF